MQAELLPRCKDGETSSSKALTGSLGLYKQKAAAAAAGIMDDVVVGMEQASHCTHLVEQMFPGPWPHHPCALVSQMMSNDYMLPT